MKNGILSSLIAAAALLIIVVSCKKDTMEEPVNTGGEQEPCVLCLGEMLSLDSATNLIAPTEFAQQVAFLQDGVMTGPNPIANKTPTGFYGFQGGVSIAYNDASIPMVCTANKITFVHARVNPGVPGLVNVKFPNTPLISVEPDTLDDSLAPYGYTVEHFFYPGIVWMSNVPGSTTNGVIDSIIIRGPEFDAVTVGADLFESELRNICISYE